MAVFRLDPILGYLESFSNFPNAIQYTTFVKVQSKMIFDIFVFQIGGSLNSLEKQIQRVCVLGVEMELWSTSYLYFLP